MRRPNIAFLKNDKINIQLNTIKKGFCTRCIDFNTQASVLKIENKELLPLLRTHAYASLFMEGYISINLISYNKYYRSEEDLRLLLEKLATKQFKKKSLEELLGNNYDSWAMLDLLKKDLPPQIIMWHYHVPD